MGIKDILPNKNLAEFVQCFRVVHMTPLLNGNDLSKFYVPKPEIILHCIVRGVQYIESLTESNTKLRVKNFISGQQTKPFILSSIGELLNFQIVFKPTAFYSLTGIPAYEFTNKFIEAGLIFNNSDYFEKLLNAKSYAEMVAIAETFVHNLILNAKNNTLRLANIFNKNLQYADNGTVQTLANESNLCEKQFKRVFHEAVGINPKKYLLKVRFFKAYNIKNANPHLDWLKIAIDCGYYDYQHLCKEYLYFTNHSPVQLHNTIETNSPEAMLGFAKEIYRDRFLQTT